MSQERERVDRLNVWASRWTPEHTEFGPHQYDGRRPWCRADEPEGMDGGAHSNASWLIQRVYDAEFDAAQRQDDLRTANDAFATLLSSVAPIIKAARALVALAGPQVHRASCPGIYALECNCDIKPLTDLRSAVHAHDAQHAPDTDPFDDARVAADMESY